MLKIRRPLGRLIFNMGIAIPGKTVFLIETGPCLLTRNHINILMKSVICEYLDALTHWGRVTHICVGNLNIIGPDNGLWPGRRQAIIWTNAGILLIEPWGTNFREMLIDIHTFSFKKIHLKMSSAKWRPFRLGLNVLMWCHGLHADGINVEIIANGTNLLGLLPIGQSTK